MPSPLILRSAALASARTARKQRKYPAREPPGDARGCAAYAAPGAARDQAISRAQNAPALLEIERLERFVDVEPADPALFERLAARRVRHEEVGDRDRPAFLLLLDAPQAPDRPRVHA